MSDDLLPVSLQAFGNEIVNIVTERFHATRQVVLLSLVGQALSKQGLEVRKVLGEQRLADFIRTNLSDRLAILSLPADPKIVAAYPSGVDLGTEIDPLGSSAVRPALRATETVSRKERIKREVWFAFSHRLAPENGRVLRLSPIIEYVDYPRDGEPPIGYQIDNDMIVPPGSMVTSDRNNTIYSNIVNWATKNNIELSDIFERETERRSNRSVLDVLLTSIPESDLSRISMPLDIVNRLRIKRI